MSKAIAIGSTVVLGLALTAQSLAANSVLPETGRLLTHEQVLHIALTEADNSQDPSPKRVEMATGALSVALHVTDSGAGTGQAGNEVVDLVVMRGYFHINAPHPRGQSIPPGKIMCLILNAHTGFVEDRSLGSKVPLLSHVGRVTRLLLTEQHTAIHRYTK
jgi:hypothetical protein